MRIKKGLQIDDDDDEEVVVQESLQNKTKTRFGKMMDDDLFGGPRRPAPKAPEKQSPEPPKKTESPPKKVEAKKVEPPKSDPKKVEPKATPSPPKQQKVAEKPPEPKKEIVPQQPHHHDQPVVKDVTVTVASSAVYNRPAYIRKLKKIAEDFQFSKQNPEKNICFDVVRPFECERGKMRRLKQPDFQDKQFPRTNSCLGNLYSKETVQFKEPKEALKNPFFGKYIDPNDIRPGSKSSPQFLSTLSCLAQMEINIKKLIEDQRLNPEGFYLVRLFINSTWRYVPVDSGLPFLNEESLGCTSYDDNESELWCSLIEKAYAKSFSGYNVFQKNTPREHYLRQLTGAPVSKYLVSDQALPKVLQGLGKGKIAVAVPNEKIMKLGLNPNYSYSILNYKNNMELRNSWGTIQERPKVNLSKQGVFQLNSQQAKDCISYVMVANVNNEYCTSTIQARHHNCFYTCHQFRISKDIHGYFTTSQWDARIVAEAAGYEYSPMRIILEKRYPDKTAQYINGAYTHQGRNTDLQVQLTAGDYRIFTAAYWVGRQYDYTLTFYGEQKIEFKRLLTVTSPNLICEGLQRYNLKKGKKTQYEFVDQYACHIKECNTILVTIKNINNEQQIQCIHDLTPISFQRLDILNVKTKGENFVGRNASELWNYKDHTAKNRKWNQKLEAGGIFTWVVQCMDDYHPGLFTKLGFK